MSKCTNCGKEGSHFVPPSLGDSGFFICTVGEQTVICPWCFEDLGERRLVDNGAVDFCLNCYEQFEVTVEVAELFPYGYAFTTVKVKQEGFALTEICKGCGQGLYVEGCGNPDCELWCESTGLTIP